MMLFPPDIILEREISCKGAAVSPNSRTAIDALEGYM
jgi:hypothetical protein